MKKLLVILLGLIVLSGCMTERRLNRICKVCPEKVIRKDSIVTKDSISIIETIRLDTVITPEDSAWYYAYLKCKDGSVPKLYNSNSKQGKRTSINVSIDTLTGKLNAKCNSDSLLQVLQHKERTERSYQLRISELESQVHVKNKEKGVIKWWYALIVSILAFIIGFIYGKYKK